MESIKKLNPDVLIENETEHYNFKNLWCDETFMIRLKKDDDLSFLEQIIFPQELSAIYHVDTTTMEFAMAPSSDSNVKSFFDFKFWYKGKEFICEYKDTSKRLLSIAEGFREIEDSSISDYRNLREMRDYLRKDDLPKYIQKYFENRCLKSFYMQGDFNSLNHDYKSLSKHFNFYVRYFNRKNPQIIIHETKTEKTKFQIPCLTNEHKFPEIITFNNLDPILLDMFQIASESNNVRLKYLFYFQILEYCSYYHLNEELSKQLKEIIRRPDLLNRSFEYSKLITDQFKDHFKHNDDSTKLEKTIIDYCTFDDIKGELRINLEFFTKPLEFDGGFSIEAILNDETCIEKPPKQIMRTIKNNIEKIRNVLVHLRESRENKVILPTSKNNNLLIPYLYLVRRMAEKVAMMHGE